jgi:UDP-N-acetylmuramoyl-L-alanyl-D-glutamate--2,6-diaminopimelate ligase
MKFAQLLDGINYESTLPHLNMLLDVDVSGITSDSRKAGAGVVFVCLKGEKTDGHIFAAAAADAGCAIIIAEHPTGACVPEIIVKDTHEVYSLCCANFFGNPAAKMKLIGVTGTNGKTTTTCIIKHVLESCGFKTGLIGTISNMSGGRELPAHYTTPEPFELQELFSEMVLDKCQYCVMEVSSHALAQKRVAGLHFIAGVFTNLTQDHLDFHKTMDNYLKAKQKLFEVSDVGIINLDDPCADTIIREASCKTVTYGATSSADFNARDIEYYPDGISYTLAGKITGKLKACLPGGFSVYNTLAAVSCAVTVGIPEIEAIGSLATFSGVKGRIEVVPSDRDFTVIIDYAHTPDGLEKILRAVKGFASGRVVALFGCGGDRDKGKRPIMGSIAAKNADYLVVTSDNPRSEDPEAIIKDILVGLEGTDTPYTVVTGRSEAIKYAIKNARKDDVIVLAGKGHEDYQVLASGRIHFDEHEIVAEIFEELRQTDTNSRLKKQQL